MAKTITFVIAIMIGLTLTGCYGDPVHRTMKYQSLQEEMLRNNKNLMTLRIGMTQEQVLQHLGPPERSEGYQWGAAWLYRTAMTSGVYGTEDGDFTPVVFDENRKIVGWGRNFFAEHVKRYEIKIT